MPNIDIYIANSDIYEFTFKDDDKSQCDFLLGTLISLILIILIILVKSFIF